MENQEQAPVMKVKDWILTLLLMIIPLVNIIMLFVWAFGTGENPNKVNWAKATLIMYAIMFVLFIFLWGSIMALVMGAMGSYQ